MDACRKFEEQERSERVARGEATLGSNSVLSKPWRGWGGGGWRDSHMEHMGMFVGNFEFYP